MTELEPDWALDTQLARDTIPIGDLPLSRLLLMEDANYPWAILVPRRPGIVEIIDLSAQDQAQLTREIASVSTTLRRTTGCHKLNVAALGNVVAQLHVHVIARFRDDAAWPRPVWGAVPARPYAGDARQRLIDALKPA